MSFCIYTVLFTLEHKNPEENKYVKMFQFWLSQLIKTNSVKRCVLLVDKRTYNTLAEAYTLNKYLAPSAKFKLDLIEFPAPKTLLEGMKYKYTFFPYKEEYLVYSDLDILIYKNLNFLNLPKEDGLYLHAEGPLTENGYLDAFKKEEIPLSKYSEPGFSAGKFIIRGQWIREKLFVKISESIKNTDKIFYTVEQPHFNRAIFFLRDIIPINPHVLKSPKISNNLRDFNIDQAVIVDFQGKPGDEEFHLGKIMDFIAFTNST